MEKVKLIEICSPKQWKTIATSELKDDGKYLVYGANGIIGYYDEYNHEKETVLITCRGATCGNVHISKEKSYINGNAMALDDLNEKVCLKEYLYYFLKQYDMKNVISGSAQPQITVQSLKNISIMITDIEAQTKIVKKLDKIQQIIDIRKKQIEELDELIKSQFVEMFGDPVENTLGWKQNKIGDICFVTKLAGFEYTKYIKYKNTGEVIMIRGLNVKNQRLKLDEVYYIDKDISDFLSRSQLHEGDICMTYVGINIGDVALVDNQNNYHLAPNVAKISLNDKINNNPVFYVYLLAYNKSNFASTATNTAKQALNMEKIRKLDVMCPPIELQNKFANFVQQIDKQKFQIQKSLEEVQKLQESLMNKYFGG